MQIKKFQWAITTYLAEKLKLKLMMTPNADKDAEKLDHSYTANRNLKDTNTVEFPLWFSSNETHY